MHYRVNCIHGQRIIWLKGNGMAERRLSLRDLQLIGGWVVVLEIEHDCNTLYPLV